MPTDGGAAPASAVVTGDHAAGVEPETKRPVEAPSPGPSEAGGAPEPVGSARPPAAVSVGVVIKSEPAPAEAAPARAAVPKAGSVLGESGASNRIAAGAPQALERRVALLLPLSGRGATLGRVMLNAAQLALFDSFDDNTLLLPADTGGTPEGARRAVRQALADRAELVLGPLFSESVRAASPLTRAAGVQMVAFSNDRSVAGGGVYILGFTPGQQVARIIGYAAKSGYRRFAALAPENDYGNTIVGALFENADQARVTVDRIEFFAPGSTNLTEVVRRLALPQAAGNGHTDRSFDSVLIAAGGRQLRAIAPLFPYFGLNGAGLRLLGTQLWLQADVLGEPALIGGWFAAPPPAQWERFEQRYHARFGASPPRRAALAYDAVALAGALLRRGAAEGRAPIDAAALVVPSGFAGLEGLFRFRADGVAERALAVYRVSATGFEVIDPAPASFTAEAM